MKLGRTIVFILLFVMVTAIYIYQARLSREVLTIVPDEVNRSVVVSELEGIDRIELRDHVRKTQIALQKDKGSWVLEVPVRYPAESRIAEGLVTMARVVSRQPRMRAEKEWEEYGLTEPGLEITFSFPEEKPVTLLIGSSVPIGRSFYAKWDSERGYFLLPSEMKSAFQQSVYGLREKRLFRASPEKFRKISAEMGSYSCQWVKDDGQWHWLEPVEKFGQKVPAGRLEPVLAALQGLHVKEFRDNNKKSKAELGFFMIHDRIRVDLEDGQTQTFYFGNEVPEENAYYGLREGEDAVFFVDREKVIELFDLLRDIERQTEDRRQETRDNGLFYPASLPQGEGM